MSFLKNHVRLLSVVAAVLTVAAIVPVIYAQAPPEPTDIHKALLSRVGEWEGKLTAFAMGPEPVEMAATEVITAVGLWTHTTFSCDFMGSVYTGTGHLGYDPAMKKIRGTWVDNMSTYLAVMEGSMDLETHTLRVSWEAPDPETGKMIPHRYESVMKKDSAVTTFYEGKKDKEVKSMTIEMQRKAGKAEKKEMKTPQ